MRTTYTSITAPVEAEIEDLHGTQRSLIVDVHPFVEPETLPRKAGFVLCEGQRPVTYVPIFPPKLRFEFMLAARDDAVAAALRDLSAR